MTMAQSDITTRIRDHVAFRLRREHPYMKTATLEKLLDSLTSNLRDSLQYQAQELQDTKARANFFMLPPELRNRIYELVLVASPPLIIKLPKYSRLTKIYRWRTIDQPYGQIPIEILRVSRQVRQEALPIFLGANTFELTVLWSNPVDMPNQLELRTL
ncbi:uncharacterized protein CLAFUR5_09090 [Fulvia fulva]|uniref:2EXR domain-containing protein n=1 Tax=Passalora fulva TaxID=5499 RepID=A0A9Q8PGD9_PASFU|nr:uncharacterized protein CLAFUR5_09090 [Fulvia fulva]UJO22124.1 hypothetical protein CLAFUR5_09090 [Fulvia fulva]